MEETSFLQTLSQGTDLLNEKIAAMKKKTRRSLAVTMPLNFMIPLVFLGK